MSIHLFELYNGIVSPPQTFAIPTYSQHYNFLITMTYVTLTLCVCLSERLTLNALAQFNV